MSKFFLNTVDDRSIVRNLSVESRSLMIVVHNYVHNRVVLFPLLKIRSVAVIFASALYAFSDYCVKKQHKTKPQKT